MIPSIAKPARGATPCAGRPGWTERLRTQRWRIVVLLLLIAYFVWLDQRIKVRPDHAFLIFLIVVLLLRQAKAFLRDWSPFIGAWIIYDLMRGIADDLRSRVVVEELYRLEVKLFGWLTHGEAPAIYSLTFQANHAGSRWISFLDNLSSGCYAMHMGAPLLVAWVLWHTTNSRRMFYRFVLSFTLINIMGFSFYLGMPTAPPWYVAEYGFVQPPAEFKGHGAGSLINFDEKIGFPLFENVYRRMNPNRFAALPSLHAAYSLFVCIFLIRRYRWKGVPSVLYPLGMGIGAVYLVHHYIVDLLLGYLIVGIAIVVGDRLLYPRLFRRWEARQRARELAAAAQENAAAGPAA